MSIARLNVHVFRAPTPAPVATSFGVMRDRPAVFVRVEDRDGAFGWGEIFANWPIAGAEHRARLLIEDIADLRIGLTGVSPLPFLVRGLDKFIGRKPDDACLEELRDAVRGQAKAMKTTLTPPHYRRRVAGALAQKLAATIF